MRLEDWRRFYAEEIRFAAHITSSALIEAFAHVPREKFLGAAPWLVGSAGAGVNKPAVLPTHNASDLYHDTTIAIDRERGINNGQPSALALWIDALDLAPGDRVFHLGCGLGYYSAIMAEVVGSDGRVDAIEIEPDLAARAKKNLEDYPNVTVFEGDGASFDPSECNAIFINAGVTHPPVPWLKQMSQGSRMVLPLTTTLEEISGKGLMIRIARETRGFSAQVISFAVIYSSASMRDPQLEAPLARALETKSLMKLKSVRLDSHERHDSCLVHGRDLCLSSADPRNNGLRE